MKGKTGILTGAFFFLLLLSPGVSVSAQAKEIPNLLSAVKAAGPGDYILLPSGKKYVLTKEEIAIARGEFDFGDLSGVRTNVQDDGTEVKTISEAHTVYVYPDGQSAHLLKTALSFTEYMKYVEKRYYISHYIDREKKYNDYAAIGSPRFKVFRASVQIAKIFNEQETLDYLTITVYNYTVGRPGGSYLMHFCEKPNFVWGNTDGTSSYRSTGKTRQLDFEVE